MLYGGTQKRLKEFRDLVRPHVFLTTIFEGAL